MQGGQTAGRTHPTLFAALSTVQMSFMSMCGLEVVFFFFFSTALTDSPRLSGVSEKEEVVMCHASLIN